MKNVSIKLTGEQLDAKIELITGNLTKVTGVAGLESIVEQLTNELAELEGLKNKSVGVDKVALFNEQFMSTNLLNVINDEVSELNYKQLEFIGEGITVKLTKDGKIALVKKSGGSGATGGTKQPSPYSKYFTPFTVVYNGDNAKDATVTDGQQEHTTAKSAVDACVAYLTKNGKELKVSTGNSMRRELVSLNKGNNLGVTVEDRENQTVYALIDSPHETAAKATNDTSEDETEATETE